MPLDFNADWVFSVWDNRDREKKEIKEEEIEFHVDSERKDIQEEEKKKGREG